jgi:hypothetical protein
MRKCLWTVAVFLLGATLWAAPAAPAPPPMPREKTPGVEAAQALSTLTGVAISPLLGVGAVGAWRYFHTTPAQRPSLPWFARPWFWGTALMLVLLVFLKDALGTALPAALKKPFDLLELFENKFSALVAAGALVPILASIFHSAGQDSQMSAWGLAAIDPVSLAALVGFLLALGTFCVVFLAGHTVNVLILISPFATLDAALKTFRVLVLASVAATSLVNPYVGALWALLIVIVSYFIAGWTLRLTVFGTVLAWDLATLRHTRFRPDPAENWAFTSRKIAGAPVRTYGTLRCDPEGRLQFRYRPWLILPSRTLLLPAGRYMVGRGLLYPELRRLEGGESEAQLTWPAHCRTHEAELARLYQCVSVQDIGLRKGLKTIWGWLKGLFGFTSQDTGAPPWPASADGRVSAGT